MQIPLPTSFHGKGRVRLVMEFIALAAALIGIAGLVYATNGTSGGLPYLMFVPVVLVAAAYGVGPGLAAGVAGGLLLGPHIPHEVMAGVPQPFQEWGFRLAVLAALAAMVGGFSRRLENFLRAQRVDQSTQLGNQAALYEALGADLENDPNSGSNVGVALLRATDLNDLINTIGVEAGDRVLAKLGHSVEQLVPEVSATYRTGDSSLGFLLDTRQSIDSERIGPAIQDAASAPIPIDQAPMRVEPAIGLAPGNSPTQPETAGELLRRGRMALHQAELLDRSWVSYDPVFDVDHSQAFELMGHVKRGLADGEFELHYQPKVSLDNATYSGVEALIRWRRSDGELISPGAYMPKLERTSLIDDVSQFVIQTAVAFAGSRPSVPVSINLAPRNLADKGLIQSVIAACQASDLAEGAFEVEVTETGLMREPKQAMAMLEELRENGIGVSIDDFGTGYSSFSYLRRLPATNLKIDREFVRELEADPRSRSLVFAMIQSGHALGMTVTAEGVETPEQREILTDYGCNLGQGFLWTPALPASDLDQWNEQRAGGQEGKVG